MAESNFTTLFPKDTIKAHDGMSVTADVWETAHAEHRDSLRAHLITQHNSGIICGLEVKANDPADHYVFITPGIAVDSLGRVIVVDQTIAYDFGDEGAGTYMLLLGYSERETESQSSDAKLMHHEYIIAARATLPKQPTVELARVTIKQKGGRIRTAADPSFPGSEELDLRFRRDNQFILNTLRVGVYCSGMHRDEILDGWRVIAQEMPRMTGTKLISDSLSKITDNLADYDILYLAISGGEDLSSSDFAAIKSYLNGGGSIIFDGIDSAGYESLKKISLAFDAAPVDPKYHALLRQPFFFKKVPEWINLNNLSADKKFVLCSDNLAIGWGGIREGHNLSREEIRTNLEWGANVIAYCVRKDN